MVSEGAPLPIVQRWLGHANLKTTLRYLHASKAAMKEFAPKAIELK
jgi:site-specific recombinase XerD